MADSDLKQLHLKIMELVSLFDQFCKQHDIEYYLLGGTALGAVRHKGFIPWDDDFDVCMTPSNYQKFLELSRQNFTYPLYLQEENSEEWPLFFSKVRLSGTTYIEEDVVGRNMHHGIFIDVMCLINLFDSKPLQFAQYLAAKTLSTNALAAKGYITNAKTKKFLLWVSHRMIGARIKRALLAFVRCLNNRETFDVGHFFGRAPFKKAVFPSEVFGAPRMLQFEGAELPAPHYVEDYLRRRFGEHYMRLPSEETKREYPSHAFIVDVNKDFKSYPEGGSDE